MALTAAYNLLNESIIHFRDRPVGTVAARDRSPAAVNYEECFVRDFVPSALVFLMDGEAEIVRNFLDAVRELRKQQKVMAGHQRAAGLMPASFKVTSEDGKERLTADFGEMAIGRVAPVDSAMWWMFILRAYARITGDDELAKGSEFQECIKQILELYLKESFETAPTMLVPDGAFMIDRRMGVYGHPLEIQALMFCTLMIAQELLLPTSGTQDLLAMVAKRLQSLRSYVRIYYWLDRDRLNEIHRYKSEEFGFDIENILNVYPESIPEFIDGWLDEGSGYLAGNLGPGRVDFRYFSLGNLLAILFGLATDDQARNIMHLYESRWDELVGEMPVKICFPAVTGQGWQLMTGSDPKNVAWSYHNGGNWPTLLWPFVAAALRTCRHDQARKALILAESRIYDDSWPEYYDGKKGSLIGRRANFQQTWTATAYIIAKHLLEEPSKCAKFKKMMFEWE